MTTHPALAKLKADIKILQGLCCRILMHGIDDPEAVVKVTDEEKATLERILENVKVGIAKLQKTSTNAPDRDIQKARAERLKKEQLTNDAILFVLNEDAAPYHRRQALLKLVETYFELSRGEKSQEGL